MNSSTYTQAQASATLSHMCVVRQPYKCLMPVILCASDTSTRPSPCQSMRCLKLCYCSLSWSLAGPRCGVYRLPSTTAQLVIDTEGSQHLRYSTFTSTHSSHAFCGSWSVRGWAMVGCQSIVLPATGFPLSGAVPAIPPLTIPAKHLLGMISRSLAARHTGSQVLCKGICT